MSAFGDGHCVKMKPWLGRETIMACRLSWLPCAGDRVRWRQGLTSPFHLTAPTTSFLFRFGMELAEVAKLLWGSSHAAPVVFHLYRQLFWFLTLHVCQGVGHQTYYVVWSQQENWICCLGLKDVFPFYGRGFSGSPGMNCKMASKPNKSIWLTTTRHPVSWMTDNVVRCINNCRSPKGERSH